MNYFSEQRKMSQIIRENGDSCYEMYCTWSNYLSLNEIFKFYWITIFLLHYAGSNIVADVSVSLKLSQTGKFLFLSQFINF